jgi:hypothetical protein
MPCSYKRSEKTEAGSFGHGEEEDEYPTPNKEFPISK